MEHFLQKLTGHEDDMKEVYLYIDSQFKELIKKNIKTLSLIKDIESQVNELRTEIEVQSGLINLKINQMKEVKDIVTENIEKLNELLI